jgi:glycosyltransferase involved in cell wall biosynthesis
MIRIGIDASNIRSGGAVTHLCEILKALDMEEAGIESIDVWSNRETLSKIEPKEGIALNTDPALEKGLLSRFYWQQRTLTTIARGRYDILYIPGGSYLGSFRPFVTMNRNLQPFDDETRRRYQPSFQKCRLALLEKIQAQTYKKAEGVIFLSNEAKRITQKKIGDDCDNTVIVPHGIASKFFNVPKQQQSLNNYTAAKPFHLLYASRINVYKHQEKVIEAVHLLREEGYPVVLDLVGSIENRQSGRLFKRALSKFDSRNEFVRYYGRIAQDQLLDFYYNADAFIFASSCETFGQILLEAMASALPIACAGRSAMPEILMDNGLYFDPQQPSSIRNVLRTLLDSRELRQRLSLAARKEAETYSWKRCAESTFHFIRSVYERAN